jgi:hypothetical protein
MEENKDISQIALERIKESGIKPISKNIFNLKKVLFWSLVGFSVIIGAISFSVTLSILFNNDWYLYNKFGFGYILKSLPYFWGISLVGLVILGEVYYRKISLGYRHRMITIVSVYIIFTVIFGFILYTIKVGEKIEQSLSQNISIYHAVIFDRDEFWKNPEQGLLAGRITEVNGNILKIIDSNNVVWFINISDAFVGNRVNIEIGEKIRIIGDVDNNIFTAEQIRPWFGNRLNEKCCGMR